MHVCLKSVLTRTPKKQQNKADIVFLYMKIDFPLTYYFSIMLVWCGFSFNFCTVAIAWAVSCLHSPYTLITPLAIPLHLWSSKKKRLCVQCAVLCVDVVIVIIAVEHTSKTLKTGFANFSPLHCQYIGLSPLYCMCLMIVHYECLFASSLNLNCPCQTRRPNSISSTV